jgi:glycosyl hydrolase family 30
MKHYTRAARRGSKRFDTLGGPEGVAHVAFVNPDGTKTVVLSNVGAQREAQLRLGDLVTKVSLPTNSITNVSWI